MRQILLSLLLVAGQSLTFGQSYKVLWNFGAAGDGANSVSNLVLDDAGNLYGTTRLGGAYGGGTAFELSPNTNGTWTETILYSFCALGCADGALPMAGLLLDSSGNLYGTTQLGGSAACPDGSGCGAIFELSPPSLPGGTWTEEVLYSFCATEINNICRDGSYPQSQLVMDSAGNIYGTTSTGGTGHYPGLGGGGTAFELSPTANVWTLSTLYNFCSVGEGKNCPDGDRPLAGLEFDGSGNLYGTTEWGGGAHYGNGVVFELSPVAGGWTESTVYGSLSKETGSSFQGGVTIVNGTLYNTYALGGEPLADCGGIFRLNSQHKYANLPLNCQNGANPAAALIVNFTNNALFGTTETGGAKGQGTVFEVSSPNYAVLHNFCSSANCLDGANPYGSLIEDQSGNFYGTTELGGTNNVGVVFEITP